MALKKRKVEKSSVKPQLTKFQKRVLAEATMLAKQQKKAGARLERIKAKAQCLMLKLIPCPECSSRRTRKNCVICGGFGQLMVEISTLGKKSDRRSGK